MPILRAKRLKIILFVSGFALVGSIIIFAVYAGTTATSFEVENGTLTGNASTLNDASASAGKAVIFNAASASGSDNCSSYPKLPTSAPTTSTAGVPSGTSLTAYSGPLTITTNNTVIDGKTITGSLVINANNVTIKNSKIHANGYYGITSDGYTGTKIINNDIYGQSGDPQYIGFTGSDTFLCGNHIWGLENGLTVGSNNVIQANLIEKLGSSSSSPHYDGIEVYSGSGNKIWGNNILMTDSSGAWLSETGAINVTSTWSNITNTEINGNWIGGGSYTLNLDEQGGYSVSSLTVTNNRWYGSASPGFAAYGPIRAQNLITVFTGNVWNTSNQPL